MAKIRQRYSKTTRKRYKIRKSDVKKGKIHCPVCGKFMKKK